MPTDNVDSVTNSNTARHDLLGATVHRDDFVSTGVEFSAAGDELAIGAGTVHYVNSGTYYRAETASRSALSVPSSSVTSIYYDFGNETFVADGTTPSEPYLKVGEVDTTGETTTTTEVNRSPSVTNRVTNTERLHNTQHVAESDDLQTRIDSAGGNSEIIVHGTHTVSLDGNIEGISLTNSNVHLYLTEGSSITLDDSEWTNSGDNGGVVVVGDGTTAISNVTISGPGTLDGNRSNQGATGVDNFGTLRLDGPVTDVRVRDCRIIDSPGEAIYVTGESAASRASRVFINNVTIKTAEEGILCRETDEWALQNSTVRDIVGQDAVEAATNSQKILIAANHFEDVAQSVDIFSDGRWAAVLGNLLINCATAGVEPSIDLQGSGDYYAIGNVIEGSGERGISVAGSSDNACVVAGNIVQNTADDGIQCNTQGAVVSHNTATDVTGVGLNLGAVGVVADSNQVVSASSNGIASNAAEQTISHNYVEGAGNRGIISNDVRATISSNTVVGATDAGIRVANVTANSVVKNNTVKNCGSFGIDLFGPDFVWVENNVLVDTQGTATQGGIECNATVDVRLRDNQGIDLTGTLVNDSGTRTVQNGVGLNAGDPNSTGDWNGNGYEGVIVRDTSNSNTYLYNNGTWSQIASA